MKNLFCLLICVLSSAFTFSQTTPSLTDSGHQSAMNKTNDRSPGYLWSRVYAWNTATQNWDTTLRYAYSWNADEIQTTVRYAYINGSFELQDSIHKTFFPGGVEFLTYDWDGSTYSPMFYRLQERDSLNNPTLLIIASSNNGVWDTLRHNSRQYSYSVNANYDSLLSLDLIEPIGMQKEYFVRIAWNSSGTEPDSIIYTVFNADIPSPGYARYDYIWDDYPTNRPNQYIQEWDPSFGIPKKRNTYFWTPSGFSDLYVEEYSNGQFDSTEWRQQQFDAQGCKTHRDDYIYQNSTWVVDERAYIELTYDANNRVIVRETFDIDSLNNPIPFSRTEYDFPLVGTAEPELPDFKATVFPNPSSGPISLQLELESASTMEFTIWDIQGKKLFAESWLQAPGNNIREFSMSLPSGIYSYRLQGEKGAKAGTLLIK